MKQNESTRKQLHDTALKAPSSSGVYFWKDEIVEDEEYLMLIKTKNILFDELKQRIIELHPYEVAEVVSLKIDNGSKAYLEWIGNSTK